MLKFLFTRFFGALGLVPALGFSAVVVMENGDRFTGEIIGEDESSLRLSIDYLGEVELPKGLVSLVEATPLPTVDEAEGDVAVVAEPEPKSKVEGKVEPVGVKGPEENRAVAGGRESSSVATADPVLAGYAKFFKRLRPFPDWDKRLQLGLTTQSGRRDKTDLNYRLDMSLKRQKNHFRFNAQYLYGKTGTVDTADKFSSDFRWRQDLTPGVFYQTDTLYSFDTIKKIESNVEQKLGLGRRFYESKAMTVSSGFGASGRWRSFTERASDEADYLVDVFQDWDYKINDRLRLRQDFKVAVPLEDSERYEYNLTAALVSDISKSMNLSLRYELGFDNSLDEDLKSDRRFISTLGYKF